MKLCPRTAPAPMAQRGGTGFPKACTHAFGVPGSVPQVQVLSLRPNKAENEPFSALFFAFSGQNRVFSHHFGTTRNFENFLTTCLTTVGAGAIHLVASASVCSAHEKPNNSKGSRRCFPREPFSLFPAYQFLFLASSYTNTTGGQQ